MRLELFEGGLMVRDGARTPPHHEERFLSDRLSVARWKGAKSGDINAKPPGNAFFSPREASLITGPSVFQTSIWLRTASTSTPPSRILASAVARTPAKSCRKKASWTQRSSIFV